MTEISTLVWDVGGVLLSNGWDRAAREKTAIKFGLDLEETERHYALIDVDFESGRLSFDEFLTRAIFYGPRPFSLDEVRTYVLAQSVPHEDVLDLVRQLASAGRYRLTVLNNEGLGLNEYRIEKFHLAEMFSTFFSSCYTGLRKPDENAYRLVTRVLQVRPAECVVIDDRPENVAAAERFGMEGIQFADVRQLRVMLRELGVSDSESR